MWYNNYVGIPYQNKGRDRSGIDCWGLVRLVYAEQYNIELPSFIDSYESGVTDIIQEAINQNKESWQSVTEPKTGDLILFNVLGFDSHLGIYVGNNYFLHAVQGAEQSVIEKLTSPAWSRRVAGFYRYDASAQALLTAHEHPLRRQQVSEYFPAGTSALEIVDKIKQKHEIYAQTETECLLFINGVKIPEQELANTIIQAGDKLEYRSLLKGRRAILTLIVLAVAINFGPQLGAQLQTALTGTAATVGGATTIGGVTVATATVGAGWAAAGTIAINIAGALLINQIAPIRTPKSEDPGQAAAANLFSGGSNPLTPYAPIPFVLGKMRYTPPLGAQQIVEFEDINKSRLNSLVVWGFGPLKIEDIQIGTKNIEDFADNPKVITYSGLDTVGIADNVAALDEIYKADTKQAIIGDPIIIQNIALGSQEADGETNPSNLRNQAEVIIDQQVDKIKIAIHFPEGLRTIKAQGNGAGNSSAAQFEANYSYQKIDANGNTIGSEISNTFPVAARTWTLDPEYIQTLYGGGEGSDYYVEEPVYRSVSLFLMPDNSVSLVYGAPSFSATSLQMESSLAEQIQLGRYSSTFKAAVNNVNTNTQPQAPTPDAIELYRFKVRGYAGLVANSLQSPILDLTTTGLGITITKTGPGNLYTQVSLAAGTVTLTTTGRGTITIGGPGEQYFRQKDAFTYVKEIQVEKSRYKVKIQRAVTNLSNQDLSGSFEPLVNIDQTIEYKRYNRAYLYAVTGYSSDTKPILDIIPNARVARSAVSILSNKNLNGNLEGINGLVTSVCLDYNTQTQLWDIFKPTNNPASLFLHVLVHPANAYKIQYSTYAELNNQINLTQLASWWAFCNENGFTYNNVVSNTISVLDLLKDIAAAGRASPTIIDGKWSVVIDRPRQVITQYFTPSNSWGFEASKALPRQPHAFRINFRNEEKGYQDDSLLVPNVGYTASTAQIIEEISIPGVTNKDIAKKHAQWQLAQAKLRPEVYTINTDIEYLVCTRGDLVKVSHDVPRWGTGSGRIKESVVANSLITGAVLDNPVYLEPAKTYKILFRTETNQTVERTLQAVQTTDYYTTVTFTQTLALNTIKPQELFIVGENGKETQELIVLAVEPQANYTARLVLSDYSPQLYNIDFDTEYPAPVYNPNYTKPPKNLIGAITSKPIIDNLGQIVSDESVLTRTASGSLISNIRIALVNPAVIEESVIAVEVEYDFANSANTIAQFRKTEPLVTGNVVLENVVDLETYKIRARYISNQGFLGPWTDYVQHQVIGKTTVPSSIAQATSTLDSNLGIIKLSWTPVADQDLNFYEVRTTNVGWGTSTGYIFRGLVTSVDLPALAANISTTYYIRAYDVLDKFSTNSVLATLTVVAPSAPINITYEYSQSSNTSSLLNVSWTKPSSGLNKAQIKHYEIELSYTQPTVRTITNIVTDTFWQTQAVWQNTASFRIRTIDILDNASAWSSTISIPKVAPATVTSYTATPNLTNLELNWVAPQKTSLPIVGYELREQDTGWGSTGYIWKGSATGTLVDMFNKVPGTYTWYLRSFDSENQYAASSTQITYTIQSPAAPEVNAPVFQDTSLTAATFTLNWTEVVPVFGLSGYKISYTYPRKSGGTETVEYITKSTTITLPANWVGTVVVSVKTIDTIANESVATQVSVTIQNPSAIPSQTYRSQVIDNNVLLYWTLPNITTLPISHVRIKRSAESITDWTLAELIGDKDGTFTSFSEQVPGTYKYWIATVDTEGNESEPIFITTQVQEPPNYVFVAEKRSLLTDKVLDLDDETDLEITNLRSNFMIEVSGAQYHNPYITTVSSVSNMSQTSEIPSRTIIGIFTGGGATTGGNERFVRTKNKVDLSNIDTAWFAVNKGGVGWGETPESGEGILVQYSLNGTSWITLRTISPSDVAFNTWTVYSLTIPAEARVAAGVFIKIRQQAFTSLSAGIFNDTWAFTSIYTHAAIENQARTDNALRNAQLVSDGIILPVDNEETWQSHFTSRGWNTPQDQVTAGYPLFIQPADFGLFSLGFGSFTEIFDFGNVLAAGIQIGLTIGRQKLAGVDPVFRYEISTSLDKVTWTTPVINSDFTIAQQNFRYVKVFLSVQATQDNDLYKITNLSIKLDTKKINNSGTAVTAANGRANINFSKPFFDVTSINVTASGTEPRITVYDFKDSIKTGTFSVSGGVCTIDTATAHQLVTGYNTRLTFSGTGSIPVSGVYIATVITTTQFTVSVDTTNNGTSGTVECYPNAMQAAVFNLFGDPVPDAQVSWYIEGY